MATESTMSRPTSFFAGVAEVGFGVEQAAFMVSYAVLAFMALQLNAIPLALTAFALSIAPFRAAMREGLSSLTHFGHTFRRTKAH